MELTLCGFGPNFIALGQRRSHGKRPEIKVAHPSLLVVEEAHRSNWSLVPGKTGHKITVSCRTDNSEWYTTNVSPKVFREILKTEKIKNPCELYQ